MVCQKELCGKILVVVGIRTHRESKSKNLRTTHKKTFIRGNGRKTQTAEEKKKYISGKASSSFEAETRFHLLILEAGNSYKYGQ